MKLKSDFWDENVEIPIKSRLHKVISDLSKTSAPLDKSNLKYRLLTADDLVDLKDLAEEWFPPNYCRGLFDSFEEGRKNGTMLHLGCFWMADKDSEILLGMVQIHYCSLLDMGKDIYSDIGMKPPLLKYNRVLNFCTNHKDFVFGHVSIIGVIEEARRLGIASSLINMAKQIALQEKPGIIAQSLHTISKGKATVACYEKLEFQKAFTIPEFYVINGKRMDARFYIRKII